MFDSSIFGEILKLLPRDLVRDSVARHEADKWSKGFSSWDHLLAMLAAQYCGVGSLRELEVVFNSPRGQHYHLATDQVHRSTLADANGRRAPGVFSDIVSGLMAAGGAGAGPTDGRPGRCSRCWTQPRSPCPAVARPGPRRIVPATVIRV